MKPLSLISSLIATVVLSCLCLAAPAGARTTMKVSPEHGLISSTSFSYTFSITESHAAIGQHYYVWLGSVSPGTACTQPEERFTQCLLAEGTVPESGEITITETIPEQDYTIVSKKYYILGQIGNGSEPGDSESEASFEPQTTLEIQREEAEKKEAEKKEAEKKEAEKKQSEKETPSSTSNPNSGSIAPSIVAPESKTGTSIITTTSPLIQPLTQAQKLAKALKQCKKLKPKSKRVKCEKAARKKYGPKPTKRK